MRRSRMRRLSAGLSLALALGLVVSGCASIPTSGPIEEEERVGAPVDEPLIRVIPRPPAAGLRPDELVARFLAASASFEDNHEVARQYLTPEAAEFWNPAARVSVFDDVSELVLKQRGRFVDVEGRQVGLITGDGALNPVPRGAFTDVFTVRRVGEEWRIADLPNGLLLSAAEVDSQFRSYNLNFLAPGSDRLVPDPVFVPTGQQGLATSLVRSLLDGPTRWLAPAVETAVPAGTALEVDSVPIENRVAQVDLSADILDADETNLRRFAAQLVWTLTQLPEVESVRMTVEGRPLQVEGVPLVQDEETWSTFDPNRYPETADPVLARGGSVYRAVGDGVEAVPGRFGSGALTLQKPAAAIDGLQVAALSDTASEVYLSQGLIAPTVDVVASGTSFSRPSFADDGSLWLVDRRDGERQRSILWWKAADAAPVRVVARDLRDRAVEQVRVSLDGTRVAVVVAGASGKGKLFLGRVVRTTETVSVQALRRLGETIDDIRDVSWQTASSMVVLGRDRGTVLQPFEIGVNGVVNQVAGTTPQGMTSITAAPGFNLLASRRGSRDVWENAGPTWREYLRGSDPAYPG